MAEVKGARLAAERELSEADPDGQFTAEQIRDLVVSLKDIPTVLADADPKAKADLYAEMGLSITYEPGSRIVIAEARPACATGCVGGGT